MQKSEGQNWIVYGWGAQVPAVNILTRGDYCVIIIQFQCLSPTDGIIFLHRIRRLLASFFGVGEKKQKSQGNEQISSGAALQALI